MLVGKRIHVRADTVVHIETRVVTRNAAISSTKDRISRSILAR